ncbi:glycosyltransferase [Patescibacteria group bacterium]|nr:glycosyltransferase [Patescibacteria group bacterium]MBU1673238.1 glycosyltransferase [Patescibacteria group bacterium]MBU1964004.1 glycosyltransferase [Patescibacteria group bacterium]
MIERVIIIQPIYFPDVKATEMFGYVDALSKKDDLEINVICAKQQDDQGQIEENVKVFHTRADDSISLGSIWRFFIDARKIIKNKSKADNKKTIIHYIQPSPAVALLIIWQKIFFPSKIIKSFYDIKTGPISRGLVHVIGRWQTVMASLFADQVSIIAEVLKDEIFPKLIQKNFKKIKNIKILPIGVNQEKFFAKPSNLLQKEYNIDCKCRIFLYIGTHGKARNLKIIIDSFKDINQGQSDSFLIFIGQGDDRENLIKYVQENNLKKILFHEAVPFEKIPDYINSADICLAYDPFENQPPLKTIECLSCNKPTIVSNSPGASEFITWFDDEMKNLLIKVEEKDIIRAMKYALQNFDTLKLKPWDRIVEDHNWDYIITNKLMPFYNDAFKQ